MSSSSQKIPLSEKEKEKEFTNFNCQELACNIQDCLKKYNYDEQKCAKEVKEYNKCIAEAKKKFGELQAKEAHKAASPSS